MAIPDFQTVMLPLVEALADGQERTMRDLTDLLADRFKLTEQERQEVLPSVQQSVFSNRVAWAKSLLKYAGLLENPSRGRGRISDLGSKVLAERPQGINVKFLKRFPAYCEFIGKSETKDEPGATSGTTTVIEEERTPLELIDASYQSLRNATTEELLTRLRRPCGPTTGRTPGRSGIRSSRRSPGYCQLARVQRSDADPQRGHPVMRMPQAAARSWLSRAESSRDEFDRFMALWIALNALYSEYQTDGERRTIGDFVFSDRYGLNSLARSWDD